MVSTHELFDPTLIATTHDVSPPASTGAFLLVTVPSESSYDAFFPQHFTPPFTTAQECEIQAPMSVTPEVSQVTETGEDESVPLEFPSW